MLIGSLAEARNLLADPEWPGRITVAGTIEALDRDDVVAFEKIFADAGLQHGDAVVIALEHSLADVAALIAAWASGLVVVPVKRNDEASYDVLIQDSGARLAIDASRHAILRVATQPRPRPRFALHTPRHVAGTDLALIIYTSGSTGRPKGIMLSHANVLAAVAAISSYLGLRSSDRILCVSPLSFDYGLYQVLFSLHVGCSVCLLGQAFNPLSCLQLCRTEGITVLPVVPSVGVAIARVAAARTVALPYLRVITNTGGHLPETAVSLLQVAFPNVSMFLMYGLSESKRALFLHPEHVRDRPGSVGKPMPGMDAKLFRRIEDQAGEYYEEIPHGEVGELFVRGASVMQGYCRDTPDSGVRVIGGNYRDDNWLSTGDLFRRDADGYFYFHGRAKQLVKQGGFCLVPRDIERVAEAHDEVVAAVLLGLEDAWGIETACLLIQLCSGDVSVMASRRMETWLSERLAADYRPRLVRLVESVPLTANGKPDRLQAIVLAEAGSGRRVVAS